MELEVSAEAKDKALNRRIAITVVLLSVFMAFAGIKDRNITKDMSRDQAQAIDLWNEYQATKTKRHLSQASADEIAALSTDPARSAKLVAADTKDVAKYAAEEPRLARQATAAQEDYDRLDQRHDQFDLADAAITTAISVAAVTALIELPWLLFVTWAFGAFGVAMGLAGFLSIDLGLDRIAGFLA
ncbi:DUF4337 domain-containing protein [Sphingomonas sp. ASV193]|uniref:DUF4337 domain-containing protein n=1 Tax=Sphingomonas sp. ASV193 TaxID=3144405 RepID=UPI0032E859CE